MHEPWGSLLHQKHSKRAVLLTTRRQLQRARAVQLQNAYLEAADKGLPLFNEAPHARQQVIPSCQDCLLLLLCQPNGVLQQSKLAFLDPQVCTCKALRVLSRLKQRSCCHGPGQRTSKQRVAMTPGDERRLSCAFEGALLDSGCISSEPGHHRVTQIALQASPRQSSSALPPDAWLTMCQALPALP